VERVRLGPTKSPHGSKAPRLGKNSVALAITSATFAQTLTITELDPTTPFEFLGFDLAFGGGNTATLNVTGLLNGSTVATDSFSHNPTFAGTFGPGNLAGVAIDELRLEFNMPVNSSLFAGNIRFETDASVPIPAPLALMTAGLCGIATLRRRRSIA